MPSVVIPAHNEKMVIERCLRSVLAEPRLENLEVIVVCNGCSDDTAQICRDFDEAIVVIETDVPSKSNALNLGDEAASTFPRMYLDADIELPEGGLKATFDAMKGSIHAAAPKPVFDTTGASLPVRMFYSAWQRVPYFNDSMIGSGVYALTEAGRARFERFPSIIADDGFVRLQFEAHERRCIDTARFVVRTPQNMSQLIGIKSRVVAGTDELHRTFPELSAREETSQSSAVKSMLFKPHLWPCFAVYIYAKRAIRKRVALKSRTGALGQWDRDDSSRGG
ncbi:MAG: glycosyltransferase family A protein [Phycisphaerales bacterium]|nr:glycosyltransferase family A protein [Phycisphaerales bacterium]